MGMREEREAREARNRALEEFGRRTEGAVEEAGAALRALRGECPSCRRRYEEPSAAPSMTIECSCASHTRVVLS
jgi:predicted phage tail protein